MVERPKQTEHEQIPPPTARRRRAPAAPVAVAFAVGIGLDQWLAGAPAQWMALSAAAVAVWGVACWRKWHLAAACSVLLAMAAAGGLWHHVRWSVVGRNHIAEYATDEARPVRLVGTVADEPYVVPRKEGNLLAAIPQYDRTVCILECRSLHSGEQTTPVSGRARVEVSGHLLDVHRGDVVDFVGRLMAPSGTRNPGAFDFRRYLRASGVHVIVRCSEPEDVRVVTSAGSFWNSLQSRLRMRAERMLESSLSRRTAPVGVALLLGTRTSIPEDLRTAFIESGTMHILAISGSNVAILAGLLWLAARAVGIWRTGSVGLILAGVLGYAFLADNQPPVLRAVLMIVALLLGRPWHRAGSPANALALAALGVLLWNPAHLFDVGAQLSFLAVAALICVPVWDGPAFLSEGNDMDDAGERTVGVWIGSGFRWLLRLVVAAHVTIAAIWLFTLPLTMARFNLLSPVGFAVNILLAPLVVVVLWCGYALLLVGLPFPSVAAPFAAGFDGGLRIMLDLIERAADFPGGHMYLSGPGDGWLAVFYVCLAAAAFGTRRGRLQFWGRRAVLAWTVCGLALPVFARPPEQLRCTFLSVGHGAAVLIELPGGGTLLYDAGQLQDGTRAQQIVQSALWNAGKNRIDALVMSHADVDHFNAVSGLARTVPVGAAFVHPSFLDFRQENVREVCETLSAEQIPIRLVWSDDRLQLDPSTTLRILHPPVGARDSLDNANSVVLVIEYAGRSILLTGDLEQNGLQALLNRPRKPVDVLLAPHHGSAKANPRALADWAAPAWVVVSGGRSDTVAQLRSVYVDANRVYSTYDQGAVTVTISATGKVDCVPFASEM
jgi:competence protein ComEC